MMAAKTLGPFLSLFLLLPASSLQAQLYQWTDARGVIHVTDDFQSVPESLRGSPRLMTRSISDLRGSFSEMPVPDRPEEQETAPIPKQPDAIIPKEPEQAKLPPLVIHYNPQHLQIVVVNSPVRAAPKQPRGVFRPNFQDRRYIHPSVFDGGPRQFIRPELFR